MQDPTAKATRIVHCVTFEGDGNWSEAQLSMPLTNLLPKVIYIMRDSSFGERKLKSQRRN
jgi:hypothetical protein